ncbi:alpha/beta hydrolase [Chryseotalea sanaruensis]|uniref:Alpha/beta hydrolase n=1 Tax=Chryseotalea sanaruensis TaxID=2482724 RepID=A0A401UE79_9BACT|nr:alpha/beta hydrolase [Chryseotalea sanaruensis]GCC53193.1 alpha/beta hydrolase [Chryseotalea sanaruensis]
MKKRKILIALLLVSAAIYLAGGRPDSPVFNLSMPQVPQEAGELETFISENEAKHQLKKDNEARIVWLNDSLKQKTEYAVVYLHGFSASQEEGNPVHRNFAKQFGCNLYLARLADHGVDTTDALLYFTADRLWETAKQALAIGKQLGNKVILLSTSTGGTVAIKLAAEYPDDVHALINLSPNIRINNPAAFLLNDPWGLQIARVVMGGKYNKTGISEESQRWQYWNGLYRLEATIQLQELLEASMVKETFEKITQPSLTLYYFKNEEEQDPQVKVSAMLKMNEQLSTPDSLKFAIAIPTAGAHVLGSPMASKDVPAVYAEIVKFATQTLKLQSQF